MSASSIRIGIIGLGYVGLPLARLFATKYPVVGFDIDSNRVEEINLGFDRTLEVTQNLLKSVLASFDQLNDDSKGLYCTASLSALSDCNFYIVTVPTPVDAHHRPDLSPLLKASETVGKVISKGDYVIFESTVYPGATEEQCIPVIEQHSSLRYKLDFHAGYSPERINPGDKLHTVEQIRKVTSGSSNEAASFIDEIYRSVISAGTFKASSIRVAEAAKVIENSQRDINIAFVNELAKIFHALDMDTLDVLEAASTKWNFLPFKPGLVGGHCIGVDPYYLAQKAQEVGYHPEIILAGRRVNDSMGQYVASEVVKMMIKRDIQVKESKVLMLGITFKENCPDIRNTKAIDIYHELNSYGIKVDLIDPWASKEEVLKEYGLNLLAEVSDKVKYQAVVLAVAHQQFATIDLQQLKGSGALLYDAKGLWPKNMVDARL